jgi:DNA-binding response OmpR family regulator
MPYKILILEDDEEMRSYVQMALKGAGFETTACATAAEARRSFAAGRPDLMICDIQLPDGDGIEFCKELGVGPGSDVRFLVLTNFGDLQNRLRGFALGAQDFISKTCVAEELLTRVNVQLANKKGHDELPRRT